MDMDFLGAGRTAPLDIDQAQQSGEALSQNEAPSILIDARINRIGRNLAFTEAKIYEELSGNMIC